jgi:hypothetical protein
MAGVPVLCEAPAPGNVPTRLPYVVELDVVELDVVELDVVELGCT